MKEIKLPFSVKRPVLATGAQTKNTVCFVRQDTAYVGSLHADLSNPKDFSDFEKEIKYFLRKKPAVIASDLHPEYSSSKYAQEVVLKCSSSKSSEDRQGVRVSKIQHHHAHIASCMIENGLKNQLVIGVAFDGTGLGPDNTLWGAEFLISDYRNFIRAAHLKEIALIGGETAILEPWRLLAALNLDMPKGLNKKQWRLVKNMQAKGFNSPKASSMGRLFDAAGSLILGKFRANFEAELAIELERIAFSFSRQAMSGEAGSRPDHLHRGAGQPRGTSYTFKIEKNKEQYIIDPEAIFRGIIKDMKAKVAKPEIAYRFHLTVAQMIRKICLILRKKYKTNKVVLSGGVFQNNLILRLALDLLYKEDFKVFIHKKLSCNDSGLSLGQAVIAGVRS
jgi:hydrogenase maturation protein HypF